MIINFFSSSFILFFICSLGIYWALPQRLRNSLLIILSLIFYISWDYRFLSILLVTIGVAYTTGKLIEQTAHKKRRKAILVAGLTAHLLLLAVFKYYGFFYDSLIDFLNILGFSLQENSLKIILPLGISFYTFQAMSYSLDVYRNKIEAEKSLHDFSLYILFFPQMIAGPIEKAATFLPEIKREKSLTMDKFSRGLFLFCYGLFKKVIIADNIFVVLNQYQETQGLHLISILLIGLLYFMQVYCDFSGYSNMARGIGQLFDIKLSENFYFPLWAKNPSDFWNRWHITLSTWVKSYLFIPLIAKFKNPYVASFICLPLMGLWHGAGWGFIGWGFYWFILTCGHQLYLRKIKPFCNLGIFLSTGIFLLFLSLSFILFRYAQGFELPSPFSQDIGTDLIFTQKIFLNFFKIFILIFIFNIFEYILYAKKNFFLIAEWSAYRQVFFYVIMFFIYRHFSGTARQDFIYFNF